MCEQQNQACAKDGKSRLAVQENLMDESSLDGDNRAYRFGLNACDNRHYSWFNPEL